ncbi:MAG: hypothetical protein ACOC32_04275 [Nanoarchaeota archaeon]
MDDMADSSGTSMRWLIGLILFLLAAGFLLLVVMKAGSLGGTS